MPLETVAFFWVSKTNRGYSRGYKTIFRKVELSIHAGYSLSFERFRPNIKKG